MVTKISQPFTFFDDISQDLTQIPDDSIVSRTLHSDSHLKAILFAFSAGQELSEHTSSKQAVLHFLEGEATVTLGEDTFPAGPGTWIQMRPDLPHSIAAHSPVSMLLLMFG